MSFRALPTKQYIHRLKGDKNRETISLGTELKLKKPDAPIISVDLGTLFNKDGLLFSDNEALLEKVENFLTEVENQPRTNNSKKGSFSQRNSRSAKHDLIVSWQGKSYALGKQGIISGGQTNLDGDKTDELEIVLRVLFALTLYELGKNDEELYLTLAIPFLNRKDFDRKEAKIRNAINKELSWGTADGKRSVKIKELKIDPEDYHAELFCRLYSADGANFEDEDRATIGLGFRTFNLGLIANDGYYDSVRSISLDGEGTSLFYGWVASEIGLNDWNNAQFIEAVNNGAARFRPQGTDEELELTEAIELATGWYVDRIIKLIKKHAPSEIERFVICGGGAIRFGKLLAAKLWGKTIVCPEPDIANAVGQLLEFAMEI